MDIRLDVPGAASVYEREKRGPGQVDRNNNREREVGLLVPQLVQASAVTLSTLPPRAVRETQKVPLVAYLIIRSTRLNAVDARRRQTTGHATLSHLTYNSVA